MLIKNYLPKEAKSKENIKIDKRSKKHGKY